MFSELKDRRWFKPYSPEWRIALGILNIAGKFAAKYESRRDFETLRVGDAMILEIPRDPLVRSEATALKMHTALAEILLPNDSFTDYLRRYRPESQRSLRLLANMCERNSKYFEGIEEFYGVSHLANRTLASKGFTIEEIPFSERWPNEIKGRAHLWIQLGMNRQWRAMRAKHGPQRKATISRAKLIELYGSESIKQSKTEVL